jgi:hypothetical protein
MEEGDTMESTPTPSRKTMDEGAGASLENMLDQID